ncbi:hypothetical protein KOR34_13760 [Posidoniimonas corsicana]|uniref:Nickel uptake substrate-specific transmembrane region n=1 Tax=Posidoniimonas corsicana TaxID=1938618 RepID=A0A5C5VF12_9BACT|nr:hypothetical protein [Posidoniimonas corsicana]TWT36470.1 hypothetical protein KOR34_13760 [Posidoniimonas corsicana]
MRTRPDTPSPFICLTLIAFTFAIGCGGREFETAAASGVVTLDGKPVTSGSVVFTPEQGWPAQGELDAEGRFVLSTFEDADGAIVGEHRVAVIAQTGEDASQHFEKPPTQPVRSLVPDRYASKMTSGLLVEVRPGAENDFELKLTSQKQR